MTPRERNEAVARLLHQLALAREDLDRACDVAKSLPGAEKISTWCQDTTVQITNQLRDGRRLLV